MKFASRVFRFAGIYGLIVLAPQFFLESKTGADYPPAVTHPEFYYGFVGCGVAFQVVFLIIATDPVRYRPLMLPSILEKGFFGVGMPILYGQHRIPALVLGFSLVDLTLGILFALAYVRTSTAARR
ncbi:MAG: hypothetical protein JO332_07195 [Planctomycetaceae bacterium]|nr:hypothetical protein [Planctomycetaceae bacterium]